MKVLQQNNNFTFNGLMKINVISADKCYKTSVRTSTKDDKALRELLQDNEYLYRYNDVRNKDDKTLENEEIKTNKFIKIIQNICRRNKLYLPKYRHDFDYPQIVRKDNKVSCFYGSDMGREEDMPVKGYKWKNVDVDIDTRNIEAVKKKVVKQINEIQRHPNFEEADFEMIAWMKKDLNSDLPYAEYYSRLLNIEQCLSTKMQDLEKNIKRFDGLPF